ncbi:MAG: cell division protein ZapE [Cardiobacteriaceae bacterium]|nr:cell division protein ZapE [Cardiobacteriaceae bacterium]
MNLLEIYRQKVVEKSFSEDEHQIAVLQIMQNIADGLFLRQKEEKNNRSFIKKILPSAKKNSTVIKGLYCWGGVGRGKTFIMDLFVEYLSQNNIRVNRRHFHRFMLEINNFLQNQGNIENPLDKIASDISRNCDIICLDEFFVSDITHAMILYRLLVALNKCGVVLVTTSNIIPKDLYKNGLQRERFLPAIDWIEENLTVHQVPDGEDFRRRHFSMENIFRIGGNEEENIQNIKSDLLEITGNQDTYQEEFYLCGTRKIPLIWRSKQSIIFAFKDLCLGNYSQKDYIDIAQRFAYVGIVSVPIIDENTEDGAKRLLLLIDEFYDRRVKVLMSLEANISEIYQGKSMRFEFDRLQSRLFDIQSEEYWKDAHLG